MEKVKHHHHGHSNAHHHHHHHVEKLTSLNGIFIFSIVLNLLFVIIEAVIGLVEGSLSLLSDAGHNLSDVFSLVLVLVAFQLAKVHSNPRFTYGYRKSTILISLLNAVILLVAVGAIIIESIHKFYEPTDVNGVAISWTAGIGIVINGLTAFLLLRGQKNDLNVRGAFLHMVADTLVSVGVVISGIIIAVTGWTIVDPIVSLIIAAVILVSTWNLLSGSLRLTLDGYDYAHTTSYRFDGAQLIGAVSLGGGYYSIDIHAQTVITYPNKGENGVVRDNNGLRVTVVEYNGGFRAIDVERYQVD